MDVAGFLQTISIAAIPILFAITLHEVAHGWVALKFGDRTAASLGRLSLNPIRHIDPVGTILVPLLLLFLGGFLFGWAKPVPVDPRNMRNPRANMVWVSAAGPAANLVMAIGWASVILLSQKFGLGIVGAWLQSMGAFGITINLLLAVFNMLPIPPLDGGQVLANLVPRGPLARLLDTIRPFGLFIVLAMVAIPGLLGAVIGPPFLYLRALLLSIFGLGG